MLFTMHLSYKVNEKDQKLVMSRLKDYSLGYAMHTVSGELTDMEIIERKVEFAFGTMELEMTVDTFGVDLNEEEQERIEMSMRESYIIFFDSPVTRDNQEIWVDEIEATVQIAESQIDE